MAQGRKTRREKETPEDEEPLMVNIRSGILKLHQAETLAHFFIIAMWRELGEHPAVKENEEWIELLNKADQALFRLTERIGREIFDIMHPEDRPGRSQSGNGQGR